MTKCPCASGKPYGSCCGPFLDPMFSKMGSANNRIFDITEPSLFSWANLYGPDIATTYTEKAGSTIFKISCYLNQVCDLYLDKGYPVTITDQDSADEAIIYVKSNILHSICAANVCLSQGLFLQSGILLRSVVEDSLVVWDLCVNPIEMTRFLSNNYNPRSVITRIKSNMPQDIIIWYGYFSANFTHTGPFHRAPYMPRRCYPDNWVLITGIQNLVRAVVTFHIALERAYLSQTKTLCLWTVIQDKPSFCENSFIFNWVGTLGNDIVEQFPPNEKKEGFVYSDKNIRPK